MITTGGKKIYHAGDTGLFLDTRPVRALLRTLERLANSVADSEFEALKLQVLACIRKAGPRKQAVTGDTIALPVEGSLPDTVEELEKAMVRRALDRAKGNQTQAAKLLGISRDTMRYRMRKHGLDS